MTEEKNWFEKTVGEVAKGLANTFRHMLPSHPTFTTQYPEEKLPVPAGYRGEHVLKKDEQGRVKCVACFMCETICPAECIKIVAGPSPWPDKEKYPQVFEIDMLRCIYCGMCEEACPVDAIALTGTYNIVAQHRQEKIYDRERLLKNAPFSQHKYDPALSSQVRFDLPSTQSH